MLELLKPDLAGRPTWRLSPLVTLADRPDVGLPRRLDAEGSPRPAVVLVDRGAPTGGLGAGHATRPGHGDPWPDHLALAPGDADDLLGAVELGLHIPAFATGDGTWELDGARVIERGRLSTPVAGRVEVDPLAVLGTAEAMAAHPELVPTDDDSALSIGATLAPALRARTGVTIL